MASGKWTEWTPKTREKFLKELRAIPNVSRAARLANVARQTAYDQREVDPAFAAEWDAAIEEGVDSLEEKAFVRAKRDSDTLMIFLLKAHRPDKYRETVRNEHTGADGGPIQSSTALDLSGLSFDQLLTLADALADSPEDGSSAGVGTP